jgi:lipid A ethanolaminephosphotransferase
MLPGSMLKSLLILAYLLCDYHSVIERLGSVGLSPALAVFAFLYLLLAAALLLAALIANGWVRLLFAAMMAAGSIFQHTFEWTTSGPLTYESFINLYNAADQTSDALAQHGHVLLKVVPVALLLFFGIALPARKAPRWPRRWAKLWPWLSVTAPLAALGLLSALLYVRGGEGSRALPAAYPSLAFAGLLMQESLKGDHGPRQGVTLPRAPMPLTRDIVLLVDESVAGNYLDINNPKGVKSGLLEPRPGVRLTNFGYAASIHSCSANSNVVLRHGGTRETYQEAMKRQPSIWAYARKAGLPTVYIDAQSTGGHLQNLMTPTERSEIDELIQFDKVPVLDRDMEIARLLAERINNGKPEFIYVNKVGAHFPIQDKYPESFMKYQPVLERGHFRNVSWLIGRPGFGGTPPEWVRFRNTYRNVLLWNVGEFFNRLFATADLDKATIVYTSDHGQDLHERGNPGRNNHCAHGISEQEEGLVPLMIIEGDKSTSLDWSAHLAETHNGLSHYRIFPTLLTLMGYDRQAMKPFYGPALDEGGSDDFSYNVVFYNYLGRKPEFRRIDRKAIVDPPVSDYSTAP